MAIVDLYSKRRHRELADATDVFAYDTIPEQLRVQVVHIWRDSIGDPGKSGAAESYKEIFDTMCREYGVFQLSENARKAPYEQLVEFFTRDASVEQALDVIDFSFRFIERTDSVGYRRRADPIQAPQAAIDELNGRMREQGVGYEFVTGCLIRIDAAVLHREAVIPALRLLAEPRFEGADEEFRRAHEHYRHGRSKEALNECLKALESTLKVICEGRGWEHSAGDAAGKLIQVVLDGGLLPCLQQAQLTALAQVLQTGVPTLRNKLSGHGQGGKPAAVPEYLASYALHLTAATIKLFIEADRKGQA